MISVVQGLYALLPLPLAHLRRIGGFVESRGQLDQPFRVDHGHLPHVLLRRHHELVIYDPVRLSLEQGAARMNVYGLVLHYCPVTLLGVLASRVEEETCSDRLPDFREVFAGGDDIQFIPEYAITARVKASIYTPDISYVYMYKTCNI